MLHKVESLDSLYFQPVYSNDIDVIIQNTYYVIYMLKTLDLYTLDSDKIENFIEASIDYTNIKNLYYCYKIIDLLSLDIELNSNDLQYLINDLFITSSHEFYKTTAHQTIDQNVLLWISDMAASDPLTINTQFEADIILGTYLSISASLSNLVLTDFDYNISFQFESDQLGDFIFTNEEDNQFSLEVYIPQRTTNYPTVEGKIVAYDNTLKLVEKTITVNTLYNQKSYKEEISAGVVLSTLFLGVPGGFIVISRKKSKRLK